MDNDLSNDLPFGCGPIRDFVVVVVITPNHIGLCTDENAPNTDSRALIRDLNTAFLLAHKVTDYL